MCVFLIAAATELSLQMIACKQIVPDLLKVLSFVHKVGSHKYIDNSKLVAVTIWRTVSLHLVFLFYLAQGTLYRTRKVCLAFVGYLLLAFLSGCRSVLFKSSEPNNLTFLRPGNEHPRQHGCGPVWHDWSSYLHKSR